MPPRSKPSKVEWSKCPDCSCLFNSRDQDRHSQACGSNLEDNEDAHGFVRDNVLFASVTKHPDAVSEALPKAIGEDWLVLHPSTMNQIGVCLGDSVTIHKTVVLPVWPNWGTPLTSVSVTEQLYDRKFSIGKRLAAVQSVSNTAVLKFAKEVFLEICGPASSHSMNSSDFCNFVANHFDGQTISEGEILQLRYYGQPQTLNVCSVNSFTSVKSNNADTLVESVEKLNIDDGIKMYRIAKETKVTLVGNESQTISKKSSLSDLGGLDLQISTLKEIASVQLDNRSSNQLSGLCVPKGILLHGPTGVGKTSLVQAIAQYYGVPLITVNGSEVWSKFYGESEAKIRSFFNEARDRSPCILLLDELDSLCPKRESSHNEVEKRVVASVLTLMDNLVSSDVPVIAVGTSSKRDDIDSALRRPGRFEKEIEIGVPSAIERNQILSCILRGIKNSLDSNGISAVASKAHGFVAADLVALCKEATLRKLKAAGGQDVCLTQGDLLQGLKYVKPSAMKEVSLEIPQVTWDDIGGQEGLKHKLRQAIEWPLKHPEAFNRLGIKPPKGLLMYGPPGCSKTMIAKALARESGLNFIAIKGPELFSKWVGESERAVREVFRKARSSAPAIVFFDEIDALAGERGSQGSGEVSDRVLAQLLTEMDGIDALQDVTVLAATNRPDRMDKALLRPGRLDRIVYVPLPDTKTRQQIFTIHIKKSPTDSDVDVTDLVQRTEGYSGAEIAAVCHEAALSAMDEDISTETIHRRHFENALQTVKPRINPELISFYESYHRKSGLHSL